MPSVRLRVGFDKLVFVTGCIPVTYNSSAVGRPSAAVGVLMGLVMLVVLLLSSSSSLKSELQALATMTVLSVILKLYLLGAGSWCCVVHSWKVSVVGAFLLMFCMDSSDDRTVGYVCVSVVVSTVGTFVVGAGFWCCVVHEWSESVVGGLRVPFFEDSSCDRTVRVVCVSVGVSLTGALVWGFSLLVGIGGVCGAGSGGLSGGGLWSCGSFVGGSFVGGEFEFGFCVSVLACWLGSCCICC